MNSPRRARRVSLSAVLTHGALGLGGATMLLPLLWMISTSLKEPGEVMTFPPEFLPRAPLRNRLAANDGLAESDGRDNDNNQTEDEIGELRMIRDSPSIGRPPRTLNVWGPPYSPEFGIREVRRYRLGAVRHGAGSL